ncbi:Alpha/Beta hydrolase protein, partial [Cladorrhinum sp. PSN259]
QTGGSGPYLANYTTDPTLSAHTIYLPNIIPAGLKLPVMVFGNGGCRADGTSFLSILTEISSHGIMVIASSSPAGTGTTTSKMLKDAIDWVVKSAGTGKYAAVDATRIAVAGQSCGGVEAYDLATDPRVTSVGILNSGAFSGQQAASFKKPTFYFLGGSGDIAYANGERDYKIIPAATPTWKGNLPVGHLGTYAETNAGRFGIAVTRFLQWTLRGNTTAGEYFSGKGATTDGWSVESRALADI